MLTLWDHRWDVFTFPLCINLFGHHICTKNKNGLITIWLTRSLTFRVYFFNQMFSSAWPQTLEVKLLKLKPLQKCNTHFLCRSCNPAPTLLYKCLSSVLLPCHTAQECEALVEYSCILTTWLARCFAFARDMLSEVPATDPGKKAGSSKKA